MGKLFVLVMLALAVGCAVEEEEEALEVTEEDMEADAQFGGADGKSDSPLSYAAVAQLAKAAGVSCDGERIAIATAVAYAESNFRPWITNTAGNTHGIDRGLWQINSYWHPEVSATCAHSPSCSARAMARISRGGTRWTEWWTWKNGKHLPFMSQARAAEASVCR